MIDGLWLDVWQELMEAFALVLSQLNRNSQYKLEGDIMT